MGWLPTIWSMATSSFNRGDLVRAGFDGSFIGHLMGQGSSRDGFEYYQRDLKDNMNIRVWAVEDRKTGEVRFFLEDAITLNG